MKKVAELVMKMERAEEAVRELKGKYGSLEKRCEEAEGTCREMERKMVESERKQRENARQIDELGDWTMSKDVDAKSDERWNEDSGKGMVRENKYDSEEAKKIQLERERREEQAKIKGERERREEEVKELGRKEKEEEEERRRRRRTDEEEERRRRRERSVVVRLAGEVGKGGEVARRVLEAMGVLTEKETVKAMGVKWGRGGKAVVVIELGSGEEVGRVMGRKKERLKGTRIFVNKDRTYEQRKKEREDRRRKWMGGSGGRGGEMRGAGWRPDGRGGRGGRSWGK